MKKCVMCDKLEPDSKTSCSACGAYLLPVQGSSKKHDRPVDRTLQSQTCPDCGSVNHGGRTKCISCGTKLEPPEEKPAVKPDVSLGDGHIMSILIVMALTVLCFFVDYWSTAGVSMGLRDCPDFFPHIYPEAMATIFMLASGGVGLFAFLIFISLSMKMQWAGKSVYYPFAFLATLLTVMELYSQWIRSDGRTILSFEGDSVVLWLISIGIVVIGMFVDRYYKDRLDCMIISDNDDQCPDEY